MANLVLVATSLLCLLLLCSSENDIAFECKPKPGCNLGSCIDIPSGLRGLTGFDENYYRMKNEYHLECRPKGQMWGNEDHPFKFVSAEKFNDFKKKVNKEFKALNGKYKELKKLLSAPMQTTPYMGNADDSESIPGSTTSTGGACAGVFYKCKCFILVENELSYGRSHFETECTELGGHLANVYDTEHYQKLATYVRQNVGKKTGNAAVHLGMKYSHKDGGPLFYDGTASDYDIVWVPGYPKANDESDGMLMYVDMEPDASFQGIFNFISTNPHPRAMCEI